MAHGKADDRLVDRVSDALTAKLEELGLKIGGLPVVERTVLAAIHARGVIGCGGLRYFYERHCEIEVVANAFETLGFTDAAQACRESIAVFPGKVVPLDDAARDRFLEQNVEQNEQAWTPLNQKVWAIDYSELSRRLASYVRLNEQASEIFRQSIAVKKGSKQ